MVDQLHAIQVHLWVLTILLTLLVAAAGYCNYSRLKQQSEPKPYAVMKEMWEKGKVKELNIYTTERLREFPNSGETLLYHAMTLMRLGQLAEARATAERFMEAQPDMARQGKEMIALLDSRPSS